MAQLPVMEETKFDKAGHIKYWQRCLKSLLPTEYTSTDSSRMMLGFFILSALDLLGAGVETLPRRDVETFKEWVLSCQHPYGGFCGSPNHKFPDECYPEGGKQIAPANVAATFFALLNLNYVGRIGDASRVKCLRWLRKLQRADGSFGEILGLNDTIEGGRDMRYCYLAASVRWMLRGDVANSGEKQLEDIDVDKLVEHIRSGEVRLSGAYGVVDC